MDHQNHDHHEMSAAATADMSPIMDHGNNNGGGMMHNGMDMHMAMSYHFGSMETILFSFWSIKTPGGILLSSLILVLFCFLYEGIKWIRTIIKKRDHEHAVALGENNAAPLRRKLTPSMLMDAGLHGLQLIFGYSLMLVFMTFNVWLCAAVVFGEAIAHLVFRFMYPELERFRGLGLSEETCCG